MTATVTEVLPVQLQPSVEKPSHTIADSNQAVIESCTATLPIEAHPNGSTEKREAANAGRLDGGAVDDESLTVCVKASSTTEASSTIPASTQDTWDAIHERMEASLERLNNLTAEINARTAERVAARAASQTSWTQSTGITSSSQQSLAPAPSTSISLPTPPATATAPWTIPILPAISSGSILGATASPRTPTVTASAVVAAPPPSSPIRPVTSPSSGNAGPRTIFQPPIIPLPRTPRAPPSVVLPTSPPINGYAIRSISTEPIPRILLRYYSEQSHSIHSEEHGFVSGNHDNMAEAAPDWDQLIRNGTVTFNTVRNHTNGIRTLTDFISLTDHPAFVLYKYSLNQVQGDCRVAFIDTESDDNDNDDDNSNNNESDGDLLIGRSDLVRDAVGGVRTNDSAGIRFAWANHFLAYRRIPASKIRYTCPIGTFSGFCQDMGIDVADYTTGVEPAISAERLLNYIEDTGAPSTGIDSLIDAFASTSISQLAI